MHGFSLSFIVPFVVASDVILEAVVGIFDFADLVEGIDEVPDRLIKSAIPSRYFARDLPEFLKISFVDWVFR